MRRGGPPAGDQCPCGQRLLCLSDPSITYMRQLETKVKLLEGDSSWCLGRLAAPQGPRCPLPPPTCSRHHPSPRWHSGPTFPLHAPSIPSALYSHSFTPRTPAREAHNLQASFHPGRLSSVHPRCPHELLRGPGRCPGLSLPKKWAACPSWVSRQGSRQARPRSDRGGLPWSCCAGLPGHRDPALSLLPAWPELRPDRPGPSQYEVSKSEMVIGLVRGDGAR